MDIKELFEAEINKDWNKTSELLLNELLPKEKEVFSYCFFSSWDKNKSKEENYNNKIKLQNSVKSIKKGCYDFNGVTIDEQNNITSGKFYHFLTSIPLKTIKKWMEKYNQEYIIYCGEETNNNLTIIFKDNTNKNIDLNKIREEISLIEGHEFYLIPHHFDCFSHAVIWKTLTNKEKIKNE